MAAAEAIREGITAAAIATEGSVDDASRASIFTHLWRVRCSNESSIADSRMFDDSEQVSA